MEETKYEIVRRILIIRLQEDLDHHCAVGIKEKADKLIDRIFNISGLYKVIDKYDTADICLQKIESA